MRKGLRDVEGNFIQPNYLQPLQITPPLQFPSHNKSSELQHRTNIFHICRGSLISRGCMFRLYKGDVGSGKCKREAEEHPHPCQQAL